MLKRRAPLDEDNMMDLLERELERGVQIEWWTTVDEDAKQSLLGGLVTAEEHVSVKRRL